MTGVSQRGKEIIASLDANQSNYMHKMLSPAALDSAQARFKGHSLGPLSGKSSYGGGGFAFASSRSRDGSGDRDPYYP